MGCVYGSETESQLWESCPEQDAPGELPLHITVPFDGLLEVREDGDYWQLIRPLVYTGARDTWTVPAGFRTDLASVPRLLTWLVPKAGVHNRAAVVHDYLCRRPDVSFRDADGVLRRISRELGVSPQRRWLMWAGVRVPHLLWARKR
jgi:hypothetical protein